MLYKVLLGMGACENFVRRHIQGALLISVIIFMFAGCIVAGERSDAEMSVSAYEVFNDYLFDYGISSELFSAPTIEARQGGLKSYKWIPIGSKGDAIGVEVIVSRLRSTKSEMILTGDTDAWLPFIGSKHKK